MGRKKVSFQKKFINAVLWSVVVEVAAWIVSSLFAAGVRWLLTPGEDD